MIHSEKVKNLRVKNFIIIFITVSLLIGTPAVLLYQGIQDDFIKEIGKNAKDTAGVIAILVEEDVENYKILLSKERGSNQAYYVSMLSLFQRLKASTGADYIFTENFISDKEIEYVLDAEIPDSEDFSPIGTIDSMSAPELYAFKNGVIVDSGVINDPYWGDFITGFAPIKDKEGNVVSLVGVDYSLNQIRSIISNLAIILFAGALILSILISIFIYRIRNERFRAKSIDYLTGLYSRYYFESKLLKETEQRRKDDKKPLSVIMIDVDNFKIINDKYGHSEGDKALKIVAEVLQHNRRQYDICARYGGDEFIIALPGATREAAITVSNRILTKIKEVGIENKNHEKYVLSLSIGIAEWDGQMSFNELMAKADSLLLISKNTGKDKYSI